MAGTPNLIRPLHTPGRWGHLLAALPGVLGEVSAAQERRRAVPPAATTWKKWFLGEIFGREQVVGGRGAEQGEPAQWSGDLIPGPSACLQLPFFVSRSEIRLFCLPLCIDITFKSGEAARPWCCLQSFLVVIRESEGWGKKSPLADVSNPK